MGKIVAKDKGPSAKRARKRSRRNGGETSVETVDRTSESIVENKGKDGKPITKDSGNSQGISTNESELKSEDSPQSQSEAIEIRRDSEPSSNTGGPEPRPSAPIPEPATPQLLPTFVSASPDTPIPLSRNTSNADRPSAEETKPATASKGRRLRFFPVLTSLTSWRSKTSNEVVELTSNISNEPQTSPQPQIGCKHFHQCPACKGRVSNKKKSHICSAGMDIDECRTEKKKRRDLKAEETEAKKAEQEAGIDKDAREWTIL